MAVLYEVINSLNLGICHFLNGTSCEWGNFDWQSGHSNSRGAGVENALDYYAEDGIHMAGAGQEIIALRIIEKLSNIK